MKLASSPLSWDRVRAWVYPAVLMTPVATAWALMQSGVPPLGAAALAIAAAGAVLWLLELWHPYVAAWRPPSQTLLLDMLHTAVSSQLISPLVKAGFALLLARVVAPHVVAMPWPDHWPVGLQVALAIPIADLGIYLGHRLMHSTALGWRLHAVHHSMERLHFWASARSHPFNVVLKLSLESGVLLLLGMPGPAFCLWLVFMTVNGLLQHANIDLRTGVLGLVLATPEVHRQHHARDVALAHCNFGNSTVLWDRLLGTFQWPKVPTTQVGLDNARIPESYGAHLLVPFVLPRFVDAAKERSQAAATT